MSNVTIATNYQTDVGQDAVERVAKCTWQSSAETVIWRVWSDGDGKEYHFEMGEADAFVKAYAECLKRKGLECRLRGIIDQG